MSHALIQGTRRLVKEFAPAKVLQSRLHKRVMTDFAEKTGLVYFGYVDQRDDDHKLVRGLTLSPSHRDNHYCIGTFQDYDMTLVERVDTIVFPGKSPQNHRWLIMAFDLHTDIDIPHVFIGLHSHNDTFYANLFTKFSTLVKIHLGTFGVHGESFTRRYAMYTTPSQAIDAQQLFDPAITKVIGDHFGSLTIEVADGIVYIYAEDQRPSQALLDKMLRYGVWLASALDAKLRSSDEQQKQLQL